MTDVAVLNDFTQAAIDLVTTQVTPSWLVDVRAKGLADFTAMPFPTRKTEEWKYTSLHALLQANYNRAADDYVIHQAETL